MVTIENVNTGRAMIERTRRVLKMTKGSVWDVKHVGNIEHSSPTSSECQHTRRTSNKKLKIYLYKENGTAE